MRINQNESTGPRPGILVLFIVLSVVLLTIWFRESDNGILHRTRLGVQAVAVPVSAVGNFVTTPMRGFISWAGDLGVSRSELQQLRSQNIRLRKRVADLEEARAENNRLSALLKMSKPSDLKTVGARVIGRPANSWEGVITIDRGTDGGLQAHMPVLGPQGLLGQTVEVAKHSARVRLVTDQRSGVAAMIQRSRASGIVRGSIDGQLTLDFVSMETTVKAGDVVITSGLGGVYPKGLVISEVTRVERSAGGLYQHIELQPPAGLGSLEELLVLIDAPTQTIETGGE